MKTKTQSLMCGLLLIAGLMLAPTAQAQGNGDGEGAKKARPERPEGGPRGAIEQMRERLGLTDEQVEKIKPILAAQQAEVQAARKAAGKEADRAELRAKMQEIREKYRAQIEEVLTPEQREKMAKARERGNRPGGPGAGGPNGPGGDATE